MLLREFWNDRFWPHCTANLRESTCVGYESAWRLHVMPCFGGMGMDAISVELVDKWLANFDTAGAARKAWAVLRAILRRAIRWNLLDVDITRRDIQLPAKPHYEPRILTIRQQRTLLRGFYGHPLEAWLICAVSCGLRPKRDTGSNGATSTCGAVSCTWSVACNGSPGMRPSCRRKPNCPAARSRCRASRSNGCASSGHARGPTHRHPHPAASRTPIQGLLQAA